MRQAVLENYKKCRERNEIFKSFGYDMEKERKFIVDVSQSVTGRILEVGTGKGHSSVAFAKEGHCFVSIDVSEEEQAFAKLNLEYFNLQNQVDLRIMDAEHLTFDDESFDFIFSVNAVHHFRDACRVSDELTRILSSKGKILLSEFTEEGFSIVDRVHALDGRTHSSGEKSLKDIAEHLQEKGYETEKKNSQFQDILIVRRRQNA